VVGNEFVHQLPALEGYIVHGLGDAVDRLYTTTRRGTTVWNEFVHHLPVLWGALLAFVVVVLLTPAVGGMARLLGVVDRPEAGRRPSRIGVPRLGGLALFFGIFIPALAFLPLSGGMRGILLGAAVATTVGAVDDLRGLRWWEKLGGQVLAAAIPVGFGVWVHSFALPLAGQHALPESVGIPLTVIGIVALMNMVNFLDGLDGLAAGVCAIAGLSFCIIDLALPAIDDAILCAIVFGACLGFLRHNFYPARIFMGDSGALLLGFTLAAVSVQGLLKTAAVTALVLPLLVLAIPVLDTSFVVAKRIKQGRPIYLADRTHLHHRFEAIGFSQRRAVVYLYLWCLVLALTALATRFVLPRSRGGEWQPINIAIDAGVALVALGSSVYVVYLLEIVKLANPFIRRRAEREVLGVERKSA
jgi:UDP-GlcNAc:undecaprenyl-phosphate GlcNAc-1-phosphate transferase